MGLFCTILWDILVFCTVKRIFQVGLLGCLLKTQGQMAHQTILHILITWLYEQMVCFQAPGNQEDWVIGHNLGFLLVVMHCMYHYLCFTAFDWYKNQEWTPDTCGCIKIWTWVPVLGWFEHILSSGPMPAPASHQISADHGWTETWWKVFSKIYISVLVWCKSIKNWLTHGLLKFAYFPWFNYMSRQVFWTCNQVPSRQGEEKLVFKFCAMLNKLCLYCRPPL